MMHVAASCLICVLKLAFGVLACIGAVIVFMAIFRKGK